MMITRIAFAGTVLLLAGLPVVASATDKELLEQAQGVFRPLPKDMATSEYPLTKERVSLGRLLFFDTRFSIDGNLGCVSCHQPALYGTDGRARSIGVRSRLVTADAAEISIDRETGVAIAPVADYIGAARRTGVVGSRERHRGLPSAVQGGLPGRPGP